jgi:hypothetical protein
MSHWLRSSTHFCFDFKWIRTVVKSVAAAAAQRDLQRKAAADDGQTHSETDF